MDTNFVPISLVKREFTDSHFDVDKITYEIFSLLENKLIFNSQPLLENTVRFEYQQLDEEEEETEEEEDDEEETQGRADLNKVKSFAESSGKVRILSIDGRGSTDGILAAKSLFVLESSLQLKTKNADARVADFFDVVAGSGIGGILAALLFTKGNDGRPMFSAEEALNFLIIHHQKLTTFSSSKRIFRRVSGHSKAKKIFRQTFGDSTMKDTLKPILIPCYDLSTRAPFLFSRADAFETDSYDFAMSEVCLATTSIMFEMKSVDKHTKIHAVDGGIVMNNPTAAAITHVLNNKQEFPYCKDVEDLLVVSLGNGESNSCDNKLDLQIPSRTDLVQIAGVGASEMVDQAVSMAFDEFVTSNYVRIQGTGLLALCGVGSTMYPSSSNSEGTKLLAIAEEMLKEKNLESMIFRGKKVGDKTNMEKLESFAGELIREKERRKMSIFPTVLLKQVTPRISSGNVTKLQPPRISSVNISALSCCY